MCLSCHFDNPEWLNDNIYLIILLRKWLVKQVDCCSDYPAKLSSFTAILQRLLAPVAGDSTFLLLIFFLSRQCSGYSKEKQTHFGFQSVQEDVKKEKVALKNSLVFNQLCLRCLVYFML